MQLVVELPDVLGERLARLPDPDTFVVQVLSQALRIESPVEGNQSYRIEDAVGLFTFDKKLVILKIVNY